MTKLYGGIDLHANNNGIVLVDDPEQVVYKKRMPNYLPKILSQLCPFQPPIYGIVVDLPTICIGWSMVS